MINCDKCEFKSCYKCDIKICVFCINHIKQEHTHLFIVEQERCGRDIYYCNDCWNIKKIKLVEKNIKKEMNKITICKIYKYIQKKYDEKITINEIENEIKSNIEYHTKQINKIKNQCDFCYVDEEDLKSEDEESEDL